MTDDQIAVLRTIADLAANFVALMFVLFVLPVAVVLFAAVVLQ